MPVLQQYRDRMWIYYLNPENNKVTRSILFYDVSGGLGSLGAVLAVEFDGQFVYALYTDRTGADEVVRAGMLPDGNLRVKETATPINNNIIDICFDGEFWYGLTATNILYFTDWKLDTLRAPSSAHGLSGELGIMSMDGKIGILAA